MNKPNTLKEFAAACVNKSSDEIYDMFENDISDSLRSSIYSSIADLRLAEPVRAALNALGVLYNVQSLINY